MSRISRINREARRLPVSVGDVAAAVNVVDAALNSVIGTSALTPAVKVTLAVSGAPHGGVSAAP